MTVTNPFQRLPQRFSGGAYALTGFLLVLLVSLWIGIARDDFGKLPDFSAMEDDVTEMKAAFYAYLTPMVIHHNEAIGKQRADLEALQTVAAGGASLSGSNRRWLNKLARQYELTSDEDLSTEQRIQQLLLRVDSIPLELALVQAAKESGWGRSRFAVEANNLFGQWCYVEGCGLVPSNRPADAGHEVEAFRTVSEAIRRYMNNLNTHESYSDFRQMRQQLRERGKPLSGMALINGLLLYSERREAYIDEIRAMLEHYQATQSQSPSQETAS